MKIKRVFLSTNVLTMLLTPNASRAIKTVAGLPSGAQLLRVDQEINFLVLTFTHSSFPDIDPGRPVPTQDIIMQWLEVMEKAPQPDDESPADEQDTNDDEQPN